MRISKLVLKGGIMEMGIFLTDLLIQVLLILSPILFIQRMGDSTMMQIVNVYSVVLVTLP